MTQAAPEFLAGNAAVGNTTHGQSNDRVGAPRAESKGQPQRGNQVGPAGRHLFLSVLLRSVRRRRA
eukprot:7414011-Alexandrium_andersonii.AAC.1